MSKYSQKEQTIIVGIAVALQAAIMSENKLLSDKKITSFHTPIPPKKKQIPEPNYVIYEQPKICFPTFINWLNQKSGISKTLVIPIALMAQFIVVIALWFIVFLAVFESADHYVLRTINIVFGILTAFSSMIAAGALISLLVLKKKYRQDFEQAWNSVEYKNECFAQYQQTQQINQQIRSFYEMKCQAAQEEYDKEMANYNNVILPKFNTEKDIKLQEKKKELDLIKKDIKENSDALEELYSNTQLIPKDYQSIDRLIWIYEDMSTSEHDIERSIDLLNTKELKSELIKIQASLDGIHRDLYAGFVGMFASIQAGNMIQSEMLSKLSEIRRSTRTGNFLNVGNLILNYKFLKNKK